MSTGSRQRRGDPPLPLRNYHLIHELYVLQDACDQQVLRQYDLISSHYRLMILLADRPGVRLTTLSDQLLLSKSTITRIVGQLEEKAWVKRINDPEDGRAQRVTLTELGHEKLKAISETHLNSLLQRSRFFEPQELEALGTLLQKQCQNLAACLHG
ncbi:MAG: MarR family transcriptional regulator [Anaerolineales bacterium]|nr:MarR family transcriptional regulator [Anaerolineales bacterium]